MLQERGILRVLGTGSFGVVSSAKAKVIRMETALKGLLTPLHPGAEGFYKDQGLLK
jgi:TRAP-type uncharacterized transport system substrate-binding protein